MSYLTGYDQNVMQSRHASFNGRWNLYFGSERAMGQGWDVGRRRTREACRLWSSAQNLFVRWLYNRCLDDRSDPYVTEFDVISIHSTGYNCIQNVTIRYATMTVYSPAELSPSPCNMQYPAERHPERAAYARICSVARFHVVVVEKGCLFSKCR